MSDSTQTPPQTTIFEIWPGTNDGKVGVMALMSTQSNLQLGTLYLADAGDGSIWPKSRSQYWAWNDGWPKEDFYTVLVETCDLTTSSPPPGVDAFVEQSLHDSSTTRDMGVGAYGIKTDADVIGYLVHRQNKNIDGHPFYLRVFSVQKAPGKTLVDDRTTETTFHYLTEIEEGIVVTADAYDALA